MPTNRKPTRVNTAGLGARPTTTRFSAPSPLRPSMSRSSADASVWKDGHMPNGDPPNLMLWGDEE